MKKINIKEITDEDYVGILANENKFIIARINSKNFAGYRVNEYKTGKFSNNFRWTESSIQKYINRFKKISRVVPQFFVCKTKEKFEEWFLN